MEKQGFSNEYEYVKELPDNMTGHIVYFEDPLIIYQTKEVSKEIIIDGKKVTRVSIISTGKKAECKFMRVIGGFGAYAVCSGRMLLGDFFQTIEDVIFNRIYQEGNTKERPTSYIPKFFTEHEQL